jgi:hypothetical protein
MSTAVRALASAAPPSSRSPQVDEIESDAGAPPSPPRTYAALILEPSDAPAAHLSPAASDPARTNLTAALAIVAFAAAWTAFQTVLNSSEALHHDMTEAYVWGREFQLGYFKHPPLWAWIAGAWFWLWPRTNWAFEVLGGVNVAVGLWGAWRLIGLFAQGERRLAALLLLMTTPLYAALAFKFNANTIFIALWPWTLYTLLRSVDRARPIDAALFGLMAAADMLSKYYAILLLIACLAAVLVHPRRKAYFTSAAPYLSVVVGAAAVAPHVWWLFANNFGPFHFFNGETGHSFGFALGKAGGLIFGILAIHALAILLVVVAGWPNRRRWAANAARLLRDPRRRVLAMIVLAPVVLTLVAGLAFRLKASTNWTIGDFPLVGLLLIEIAAPEPRRLTRMAGGAAVAGAVVALALSPWAAMRAFHDKVGEASEPRIELAAAARKVWSARSAGPMGFVAGAPQYAEAVVFYGDDPASEFTDFDPRHAPWVTPDALARRGLIAVCARDDAACLAAAARLATPRSNWSDLTLAHGYRGQQRAPVAFRLMVRPPDL